MCSRKSRPEWGLAMAQDQTQGRSQALVAGPQPRLLWGPGSAQAGTLARPGPLDRHPGWRRWPEATGLPHGSGFPEDVGLLFVAGLPGFELIRSRAPGRHQLTRRGERGLPCPHTRRHVYTRGQVSVWNNNGWSDMLPASPRPRPWRPRAHERQGPHSHGHSPPRVTQDQRAGDSCTRGSWPWES